MFVGIFFKEKFSDQNSRETGYQVSSQFQTQNSVYEIVSDVNSRQDMIEERLTCLEEKLNNIQLSLELLPDLLTR